MNQQRETARVTQETNYGPKGDFWARYDKLPDAHDSAMMGRLNGNLDVLLIFVSPFLITPPAILPKAFLLMML